MNAIFSDGKLRGPASVSEGLDEEFSRQRIVAVQAFLAGSAVAGGCPSVLFDEGEKRGEGYI